MVKPAPTRPDPGISEKSPRRQRSRRRVGVLEVLCEVVGFLLVVTAIALVYVPLAIGVAGAGLILVANRPERPPTEQGSADARTATLP